MISILAAVAYFWILVKLARRYPWAAVALTFLIISFTWRVVSVVYIDLYGPIFADELGFDIGPGTSTPFFVTSVFLVLGTVIAFQARVIPQENKLGLTLLGMSHKFISGVAFLGGIAWLVVCYGEMIAIGTIPLLEGMDRLVYQAYLAGPIYRAAYTYGFLYSIVLGYFFVQKRWTSGRFDFRFFYLFAGYWAFFILTGNRFSILIVTGCYFVMPLGAYLLMQQRGGALLPPDAHEGPLQRFLISPSGRKFALGSLAVLLGVILLNNYFNVRYAEYQGAAEQALFQRIFVQQAQLYIVTWERVASGELLDSGLALDLMFGNAIDPSRNTGIQYLMVATLGEDRATEILEANAQYAGGYPEVLIELFGLALSLVPMIVAAVCLAILHRLVLIATCYGRVLTLFMSGYILFTVNLLYIGGMLNFLINPTLWLKVAVLAVILVVEPQLLRRPSSSRQAPAPEYYPVPGE
jgi:hypothetical protein